MMNGSDRGDAVYAVVAAQAGFDKLSDAEKASVKASLRAFWAADLSYITAHAQVNPSTLQSPAGQPVSTTGGPAAQTGATTAPASLLGLGTVS